MLKKIFWSVGLIILVLLLWNWQLVVYGVRQGYGQMRIVWNAKPIEEFLANPHFPDSLKAKLLLIQEIRTYAIDSLGLKDTENYKTLFDQKGEEIMWVVQACEPYQLKARQWDFPVVGTVPYKGFFEKQKALDERAKLEAEGYDVSIRNPGGWSTLGWFTDPVLSSMLKRNEGDLASLIIHEMVHATIFVKDDVDFNENLASFIADTAAYYFLASRYGKNSAEFTQYWQEDQDYRRYSKHILRGTRMLDSLYQSFTDSTPVLVKQQEKKNMIERIMNSADTLQLYQPRKTSGRLPNNTYFMSYHLYQAKQHTFSAELNKDFNNDLRKYIKHLEQKHPFL
ncbi:MAG: aminopeptidase [Bacteroidota bacterium]|nr:MAG: aminopeptidase [Bacteroidota bacterium]HNR73394.1 aminopeptidase [Cyclobacteriaceae bacterium]HNU41712.1 aminopeptidase [Cyclobacteriaceae bacterium]